MAFKIINSLRLGAIIECKSKSKALAGTGMQLAKTDQAALQKVQQVKAAVEQERLLGAGDGILDVERKAHSSR